MGWMVSGIFGRIINLSALGPSFPAWMLNWLGPYSQSFSFPRRCTVQQWIHVYIDEEGEICCTPFITCTSPSTPHQKCRWSLPELRWSATEAHSASASACFAHEPSIRGTIPRDQTIIPQLIMVTIFTGPEEDIHCLVLYFTRRWIHRLSDPASFHLRHLSHGTAAEEKKKIDRQRSMPTAQWWWTFEQIRFRPFFISSSISSPSLFLLSSFRALISFS